MKENYKTYQATAPTAAYIETVRAFLTLRHQLFKAVKVQRTLEIAERETEALRPHFDAIGAYITENLLLCMDDGFTTPNGPSNAI